MKIIDEKGRLFGKINVIDFLVILFLLCLTPILYFGYSFFARSAAVPIKEKEIIEIFLDCKFTKVNPQILKLIKVGDKEIDENKITIADITWIGQSEPFKHYFNIGSDMFSVEDPKLKDISVKLKIQAEIRDNLLYYKNKKIVLNSPIEFKTQKYTITGIIEVIVSEKK